jgi:hypothetical protein
MVIKIKNKDTPLPAICSGVAIVFFKRKLKRGNDAY